jgi:hypothetical protein
MTFIIVDKICTKEVCLFISILTVSTYLLNAPKKELGLPVASSMENTGDENSLK